MAEAKKKEAKTEKVTLKGVVKHRGKWRKEGEQIDVTAKAKALLTKKGKI